ncbi:MAG: hypothetical protein M5R36_19350 [Deltaproteobacteria bacterium]|nr:hypothetical protein [Deltaproteobacteria bacterium]
MDEARYYLAESLYQTGYAEDARREFRIIRAIGPSSEYFAFSLVRMIQLALRRGEFDAAESLYSELLAQMPPGYDGSLGRYIYGRALIERGDGEKGAGILESVSEDGDYFGMAQYFLAVQDVRAKDYHRAINRLRRIKSLVGEFTPKSEEVLEQTELSLGRLHYEIDDFPRAVASYTAVDPKSKHFADAMYESLWVLLTRNDYMILKIHDEQLDFDHMSNEFGDFTETFEVIRSSEGADAMTGEVTDLNETMADMRAMFAKIDEHLANLQKEAIGNYDQLVENAPNSSRVPEAGLLLGNIYTQAEDFQNAKDVFRRMQSKYTDYYNRLTAGYPRLHDDSAMMAMVGAGLAETDAYEGRDIPASLPANMPEEVAYWLAEDKKVRELFAIYEESLAKRRDLDEMLRLIDECERELRALENSAFPILKETRRRSLELIQRSETLRTRIGAATTHPDIGESQSEKISAYLPILAGDEAKLLALQSTLEQKKNQTLAAYRQTYRELSQPVAAYQPSVDQVYAEAANAAARQAREEMGSIQNKLLGFVQKSRAGIVDAEYREAETAARDIKDIQKEMNEELRRFRIQYQTKDKASSSDDGSADEE